MIRLYFEFTFRLRHHSLNSVFDPRMNPKRDELLSQDLEILDYLGHPGLEDLSVVFVSRQSF